MLVLQQVSKVFGNQRGVKNIDFSMTRGEIVGFLGPNGAGKTTTMRLITGYINPTSGKILIDNLSMEQHIRETRRKIGYLPETPPLYPEMTVKSYLAFIANLRNVPVRGQNKRISGVIHKLGLDGREKQVIRGLSKGYKQRLGLAQAIIHEPDLLILDEPTSGLDPNQIIEIRELIRELGENHTVLLSTHILSEVSAICDRALIIHNGSLVLDERLDQISTAMENKFEVNVEIVGPRESILAQLAEMDEIVQVEELDQPVQRETTVPVRLKLTTASPKDIREALFYRMAACSYPIISMNKEGSSLEDIFTKLTSGEKPNA